MDLNKIDVVIQELGKYYNELKIKGIYERDIQSKIYEKITNIDYFYNSPDYSFSELLEFKEQLQFQFYCMNRCIEFSNETTPLELSKLGNNFGVPTTPEKGTFVIRKPDGSIGHYKKYRFVSSNHFIGFSTENYNLGSSYNIKFYFNMETKNIIPLLNDLLKLAQDEDLDFYAKSRPINCNDMVTIRVKDIEKIGRVYELIKKYKIPFNSVPILPLDEEGIGITLDNSESFNNYFAALLCNYFKSSMKINISSFIDYWHNINTNNHVFTYNVNNILEPNQNLLEKSIEEFKQLNTKKYYK